MKVRLIGSATYDRHEGELRFDAQVGRVSIPISMTVQALLMVNEARGVNIADPQVAYAAGGSLIERVVRQVIEETGEIQTSYFIDHKAVLRLTGSVDGAAVIPLRWGNR